MKRNVFSELSEGFDALKADRAIIYDIKGLFPKDQVDGRL